MGGQRVADGAPADGLGQGEQPERRAGAVGGAQIPEDLAEEGVIVVVDGARARPHDEAQVALRALGLGVEAQGLAEEMGGGVVLVVARGELAEEAIGGGGARVEANDIAEIGLGLEVTTQGDIGPGAEQQQRDALGLVVESVRADRDDARIMPGRKQLQGCRDDSAVHGWRRSKGWARRDQRQADGIRARGSAWTGGGSETSVPRPGAS